MKLNFKKRKAETFAESVVAIAVFGILLLGLTDFMSSQISYVARLKHRDKIISKAQELITGKNFFEIIRTADSFKANDSTWPEGIKNLEDKEIKHDLHFYANTMKERKMLVKENLQSKQENKSDISMRSDLENLNDKINNIFNSFFEYYEKNKNNLK